MSCYDEMVAAGRSKSLTTGNVRRRVAAVHEVLGSLALETPVYCHSELMDDSLRNIEPVQLRVEQMCQASVELPSITDGNWIELNSTQNWIVHNTVIFPFLQTNITSQMWPSGGKGGAGAGSQSHCCLLWLFHDNSTSRFPVVLLTNKHGCKKL